MSGLFGVELPTPVNFVIAFVFVLLLIGAAAWLVRRFGATRTEAQTRGRQPRLAVVDFAAVDSRRKLVIIRRDNVEHLLMIGGPSDVVVETNIVRAAAATTRDAPAARNGDTARPVTVPDPTQWPLQPETGPAIPSAMPPLTPSRADRAARTPSDEAWQSPVEPAMPPPPIPDVRPVLRPAETLAGLADDLARPIEPVAVRPVQVQPTRLASSPVPSALAAPVATDQSLAEMAQRLEAALRRPGAQKVVTETQRVTATLDIKAAPPKSAAQMRSGGAQPSPQQQADLEQEMASLLSKPGKT
jgi:flagellar biogenesis protein FliO